MISFDDQGGDDCTAFGEKNIVGTAGRSGIHHLNAKAFVKQWGKNGSLRKTLSGACPEEDNVAIMGKCEQVVAFKVLDSRYRPVRNKTIVADNNAVPMNLSIDRHEAGTVSSNRVLSLRSFGLKFHLDGELNLS
jgi:hypothetical protein